MARAREYIDKRQWDHLATSIRFADEVGRSLNTFVTIQYGATSCEQADAGTAFRRLVKNHFTQWLRPSKGHPFDHRPSAWVYFVEDVPAARFPHGRHVHWLVHIPQGRRDIFEERLPLWLMRTAGHVFDKGAAIDIRDAHNPLGVALYAGKALKPADARKRKIRPEFQGLVHGRRLSISQSIGPSAINAHRERLRQSKWSREPTVIKPTYSAANDEYQDVAKVPPW